MLQTTPRQDGFSATLQMHRGFSLFPDHFRNSPIVPGICLIQAVLLAAAQWKGVPGLRLRRVRNAKFLAPAAPDDTITIEAQCTTDDDGSVAINAHLSAAGKSLAKLWLIVAPEITEAEATQ